VGSANADQPTQIDDADRRVMGRARNRRRGSAAG
jgi:hypothetical protein